LTICNGCFTLTRIPERNVMSDRVENRGLRLLQLLIGSITASLLSSLIAARVLRAEPASAIVRGAMVALAVGGVLPWIWALARVIRAQDEFSRRLHLIAISIAFGAMALLVFTAMFLQEAGFIDYISLPAILGTMMVVWWLSIVVTTRYYR
jgi:hypothetical protein